MTAIIFDPQPAFAWGLAKLLEDQAPDVAVTGVTASPSQAERLIRETLPDVALIGLCMESVDVDWVREICSVSPATEVVVLVPGVEVQPAYAALSGADVSGYVAKERDVAEIAEVIRLVVRGHFVMPNDISEQRGIKRVDVRSLTDVEREILKGIALGETNAKIAGRLHMSQRTISRRLETIYAKLDLSDRLQAAVYAATHGIVKPPPMAS